MSTPNMESTWGVLLEEVAALSDRPRDGKLLDKVDAAIKDLVFYDDDLATDEYLVHYTSWERALAILKEPEPLLRSYNYEWTNDPRRESCGERLGMGWPLVPGGWTSSCRLMTRHYFALGEAPEARSAAVFLRANPEWKTI